MSKLKIGDYVTIVAKVTATDENEDGDAELNICQRDRRWSSVIMPIHACKKMNDGEVMLWKLENE